MASLIPGFEYDVFISYRQKDNKHDGWVTEFVDNLKGELEATFKEDISVYFDINPHDGLLETHDVDASLKDKLKCLVFIPIISRTYCDPKSFAWEHEFKTFVEQASQDQFGLKVKLPNGNVASRVLPIRIHDLDAGDIKLCESVLGVVLRGIEFIYKEPGINRSLSPKDHEERNLNNTNYRNQVNKVALAIKDIITAIEQHEQKYEEVSKKVIEPLSIPKKSNKTAIIAGSIILLALIILGFFFIPRLFKSEKQGEKSIAVLPFKLLSDEPGKQYLADGMMDAITLHLSKIKDLRVMSRTSVEQYRGTTKTTRQIGKELDVAYLLEGSFQKFGNNAKLIVQLIKASEEGHVWGNEYNNKWSDVFTLQSEVAQKIASELKAVVSPEEKQLIEKIPTASLTAYDFYTRGKEELKKYWSDNNNKLALGKAEDLYHKALDNDPAFAPAYIGLAYVYWAKHGDEEYFSKHYVDSVLILCDIALSFDNKLSEAYTQKGWYYSAVGKPEQAIEEYDKAIKLNPNDWAAYWNTGGYYSFLNIDLVKSINYLQKAASLNHGLELPAILKDVGDVYCYAGFPEKAKYYCQEKLKLDDDSCAYYSSLGFFENWLANYDKSIEFGFKAYALDSTNENILILLGHDYLFLGQYEESLKYYKKYIEKLKTQGRLSEIDGINVGYVYWQNGKKEEAEYYFKFTQVKDLIRMNELKRSLSEARYTYFDLATIYAFRGEKDEAFKNLRIFNQVQRVPLWIATVIKNTPLFDCIRNEPEFQQIVRDVESKYQAEHERVRKWLEEQGKL